MDTEGWFAPETPAAARERYEDLGSTAQVVVREVAKAMDLSPEAYDERVTADVIETAREVLFAASLEVHVGTRSEYEDATADLDLDRTEIGTENVDNVVWHVAPAAETVVAATFQDERGAAVETLRRHAFGHCYRDLL